MAECELQSTLRMRNFGCIVVSSDADMCRDPSFSGLESVDCV